MTAPDTIRKFEYRPCRIPAGFEIDFDVQGDVFHGTCKDVSNAGIRATLDSPVGVGCSGQLTLRHPAGLLQIEAQVAYVQKQYVGLVFHFKTPWESSATIEYMASIANYAADTLVVPFI